ncbi:MAG: hypothetical protein GY818_23245, partial [Planctomycetaceae bacterium]|nr:hypothetical protein [Planctomycetaceae bacterium]
MTENPIQTRNRTEKRSAQTAEIVNIYKVYEREESVSTFTQKARSQRRRRLGETKHTIKREIASEMKATARTGAEISATVAETAVTKAKMTDMIAGISAETMTTVTKASHVTFIKKGPVVGPTILGRLTVTDVATKDMPCLSVRQRIQSEIAEIRSQTKKIGSRTPRER